MKVNEIPTGFAIIIETNRFAGNFQNNLAKYLGYEQGFWLEYNGLPNSVAILFTEHPTPAVCKHIRDKAAKFAVLKRERWEEHLYPSIILSIKLLKKTFVEKTIS